MNEVTAHRRVVFEGELLTVEVHDVRLDDGRLSRRELVFHPDAVCVVVLTKDGQTVFVRQFRKAIEQEILEIPAGKIDPGETAAQAALRELQEEVGFLTGHVHHVMDFYSSPGFCRERLSLFVAKDVELGPQHLDEGEVIELVFVSWQQAVAMALSGDLGDAKTVAGILAVAQSLIVGA